MTVYSKPLSNHIVEEKHRGVFQNNNTLTEFYDAMSVPKLIQEAERLKFSKHFTMAAQALQIAQKKMYKNKEKRLDYLLKYPMYLQLCGKEYSGWMEFFSIKKLLFSYEKNNEITLSELLFYESKISNVMSIFQERKKEYASTIFYTLRSYIEILLSLHHNIIQQKEQEFSTTDENLKKSFRSLSIQGEHYLKLKQASFQIVSMLATPLHRIGYLPLLESYFDLTKETLKDIPNIDYLTLEEQVQEIFNNYIRVDEVF